MDQKQKNRKTVRRLVLVAVGMFGFGFALWPLYNVLCEVTGLGGRAIQVSHDMQSLKTELSLIDFQFCTVQF